MTTQRQSSMRLYLASSMAILYTFTASAGTIQFARSGLNARSSMSFAKGAKNIRATVPQGSEGDVIARFKLPSGNYAVKVKFTKLGNESTRLKTGDEVWVYYHNDADRRRVELFDDAGKKAENAEAGTWAVALSTFKTVISNPEVKKEEEKKVAEAVCTDCDTKQPSQDVVDPLPDPQFGALSDIADKVKEDEEQVAEADVPNLDVGVEEIMTYMAKEQKAKLKKSQARSMDEKSNRLIAQTIIDECTKQGVPVSLVLAVIQKESHFYSKAHSPAGARGIMQIMPITYRDVTDGKRDYSNLYNPVVSIKIGVGELADNLKTFNGDVKKALAAYNMGVTGYKKVLAGKKTMPSETKNYIPKVLAHQNEYLAYESTSKTSLNVASTR